MQYTVLYMYMLLSYDYHMTTHHVHLVLFFDASVGQNVCDLTLKASYSPVCSWPAYESIFVWSELEEVSHFTGGTFDMELQTPLLAD